MSNQPRLSVAMIVRNGEDVIRRTLESIREIADEIVICETGSERESAEIAQEHEAVWCHYAWDDDFSAARNFCLQRVTGQWVLWLDAGEVIDAVDAQRLSAFVAGEADSERAYMLLVQVPTCGNMEGEQIGAVRLVPNYPFMRFTGRVRESLLPCLNQMTMEVDGLPYRIQRGPNEHNAERKQQVAERNLRIADIEVAEYGPTPRMYNCMGDAQQVLGRQKQAVDAYQKALELAEVGGTDMLESFYGLLTVLETIPEGVEQQMDLCLKALEHYHLDAQLLCAMGGYLQRQGRLDLAARSYETAFRFGTIHPHVWHVGAIKEIAAVCCGLALQLQQKDDIALAVLQQAVAEHPESDRVRRQLLGLYIKQGEREEALWQLEQLADRPEPVEAMRGAVRGACLASQENWVAATGYLRGAFEGGCRDPLCLRWLTVSLINQQKAGEASDILRAWRAIDPADAEMLQYWQLLFGAPLAENESSSTGATRVDAASDSSLTAPTNANIRAGNSTPQPPN